MLLGATMKSAMIGNAAIVCSLAYLLRQNFPGPISHIIIWASVLIIVVVSRLLFFKKPLNSPPNDYNYCQSIERNYAIVSMLGAFGIGFGSFYFSLSSSPIYVAAIIIIGQAAIAGGMSSYMASKISSLAFLFGINIPLISLITWKAFHQSEEYYVLTALGLFYTAIMVKVTNENFKKIIDSIDEKILNQDLATEVQHQKDEITLVISSFPGIVVWVDENFVIKGQNTKFCHFAFEMAQNHRVQNLRDIDGSCEGWNEFVRDIEASDSKALTPLQKEYCFKHDDAEEFYFMNVRHFENNILIAGTNITEQVHLRRQKELEKVKAQETAKLVSLGEMAAGIAHEINNPMTIIDGSAMKISRSHDKDEINRYTEKIQRMVTRVSSIIRSMKKISRDGSRDEFEPVTIKNLIADLQVLSEAKLKQNGIEFKLELLETSRTFPCRDVEISQILINLLNNSIDAFAESKEIKNPYIKISNRFHREYVEIEIEDNGPGIPKELVHKVMEPFFTTKKIGVGTGLGLSIIGKIVENHQGKFELISSQSPTRFVISLPLEQSKQKNGEAA